MKLPKPRITKNRGWESEFICQSIEQLVDGELNILGQGSSYKEAYQDWLGECSNWYESEKEENEQ